MLKVKKSECSVNPKNAALNRLKIAGNTFTLTSMLNAPAPANIKRIDRDHYIDLQSGEILSYNHAEHRGQSLQGIYRTLSKIRDYINTNVLVPQNARWVTLTYAENMTDTERLCRDYEKFWKRFLYWNKKHGYSKPDYISVIEPQGRGAWHAHVFFLWQESAPFISNDVLSGLWGHGFVKIKAVRDVDNIGAYFAAYLADMPLDEVLQLDFAEKDKALIGHTVVEKEVDLDGITVKKAIVKGARLYMYPSGMNIIRTSKGIKSPVIEDYTPEYKKKLSGATESFLRTYQVFNDDGLLVNAITRTHYTMCRKA